MQQWDRLGIDGEDRSVEKQDNVVIEVPGIVRGSWVGKRKAHAPGSSLLQSSGLFVDHGRLMEEDSTHQRAWKSWEHDIDLLSCFIDL